MKFVNRILSIVVCAAIIVSLTPVVEAQAAGEYKVTGSASDIQLVDNIDNITVGNSPKNIGYWLGLGVSAAIPVDLKKFGNGTLKVMFSIDKDFTQSYGTAYICKEKDLGTSQMLTDVKSVSFINNSFMTCLDGGQTYYLVVEWTNRDGVEIIYDTQISVSLLYEEAKSNEVSNNTSFSNATNLKEEQTRNGFITVESKTDHYMFRVDGNEKIKLMFTFDGARNESGSGTVRILNSNKEEIDSYSVSCMAANKVSELTMETPKLQPGVYYVTLSGLYGATTLRYSRISLDVNLTQVTKNWSGSTDIDVKTNIDVNRMLYVKGKVKEADKDSNSYWKDAAYVYDNCFNVTENGTYTVRVEGRDGSITLGYIDVENIDSVMPNVTGIIDNTAYTVARVIKFSDKGSGIKSAKINKFDILSGAWVSDEGRYDLSVEDKAGNKQSFTFFIDRTKPVIDGIANGKTYYTGVEVTYKDTISGLKSVTLDGEEINFEAFEVLRLQTIGDHVVVAVDHANNKTTVKFSIDYRN